MIEIRDGQHTRRVQSRRLAALIRALLIDERLGRLDEWRVGHLTLSWSGDKCKVSEFAAKDFESVNSAGPG